MFEGISFLTSVAERPLISRNITKETYSSGKYDPENLANSEFYLLGSAENFCKLPITDFAQNNLLYLQAFTIFSYRKGSYTRRQNFNSFLVLYTYEGVGEVEYCGKSFELKSGDGILIDCRKPHYYCAVEDWKVAVLHIYGPLAEHYSDEYIKSGQLVFNEAVSGRFHRYVEQLLEIYESPSLHRDLRAHHAIDGLLLYLTVLSANLAIHKQDVPKAVQQAMKHIEEHFTQQISLDDLAAITRSDKYHLAKMFKRYTGFSPHNYLILLRINQAKSLLKTTTLPANKIAHQVGIHDINNFNYLFKKRVGMTPIQYRNCADYIL